LQPTSIKHPINFRHGVRPADRRPLHDDEAGALQVLHKALGDNPRHHLGGVTLPLAAVAAQANAKASAILSRRLWRNPRDTTQRARPSLLACERRSVARFKALSEPARS